MQIKTSIIAIGNSRGVRLPKAALEEAALPEAVILQVEPGKITIAADPDAYVITEESLMAEPTLLRDWNNEDEDEAWKSLQ